MKMTANAPVSAARLPVVTHNNGGEPEIDPNARGAAIKQRRLRQGIKSQRVFAETTGISRDAIIAAEKGEASTITYDRLEAWLDRFEEEVGDEADEQPREGDMVEFQVEGLYGAARVVVKGPVSDLAQIEAAVERLIRRSTPQTGQ